MTTHSLSPIPFLDLKGQHAALKEELLALFAQALDKAEFIGGGQVAGFEAEFAAFTGAAQAVGVANGTDALRLALLGLGIGPGDRVVTVPNTFIATVEAISHCGAHPEFVDVEPDTCLMDPNRLETFLKARFTGGPAAERPRAVIPVHLYGQCADMTAIRELAARYEVLVLEDAAQAHGATHAGHPAGSMSPTAFSFYPGKNLGACGDAGAVTTQDPALAERLRVLRDHGQTAKHQHQVIGCNSRLDALQAAALRVKLPHLPLWNTRRRAVADRYDAAFANLGWLRPVTIRANNLPARHLYVVHAREREALQEHLSRQGVNTALHYPVPVHLQPCYAHLGHAPGSFPHAEASARELVSLPLFPEMDDDQVARVIAAVLSHDMDRLLP